MPKIILHDFENRPVDVLVNYIERLVPIKNHVYFPELKTQVILKSGSLLCSGRDNWIYVKETPEKIKYFMTICTF